MPIAVTWHAGTFYAAIEVMEAAGVPFDEIKLEHANDRLDALLSGKNEAAALMEPLVSRARSAGCRKIADLRWRGGIVAGDDVDEETAEKLRRALNRAVEWLRENEDRSREELLRDLTPEQRKSGLLPELIGVQSYQAGRIPGEGRLDARPRLPDGRARLQGRGARQVTLQPRDAPSALRDDRCGLALPPASRRARRIAAQDRARRFVRLAKSAGEPQIPGLKIVYLSPLGNPADAPWKNIIVHQTEGPAGSAHALAKAQAANPTKRGVTLWVETDGTVYWSVPETAIPTHGDGANRNDNKYIDNSKTYRNVIKTNSIGVEFVGNHPDVRKPPTAAQFTAWLVLVRFLQARYDIPIERVYAHNWIDYKDHRYCEGCDLAIRVRAAAGLPPPSPPPRPIRAGSQAKPSQQLPQ